MKKPAQKYPRQEHRTDFDRLVDRHLLKIQEDLMPEKAEMVVAINLDTGEYVLGSDTAQARAGYLERWPEGGYYICRVDGSPAMQV